MLALSLGMEAFAFAAPVVLIAVGLYMWGFVYGWRLPAALGAVIAIAALVEIVR